MGWGRQQYAITEKVLLVDEVDDERTTLAFAIGELLAENPAESACS